MIRDHYPKMAADSGDASLVAAVSAIVPRVFEFTELLVDRFGVTDVGAAFPHTVTYHASCHAIRALNLREQPLKLLQAVRGLELRPLPRLEECCGFGGTFSLKNADVSSAMLADKQAAVLETGAEVCTAVRQLLPAAHRRRAERARARRSAACTWPRSSRRQAVRHDPRRACGRRRVVSRRREGTARAAPAADEPAPRDRHDPGEARRRSWPRCPTGRSCGSRPGRSRTTRCATSTPAWPSSRQRCTAAGGHVHWARDADEANGIVVDILRAHGAVEIIKVKSHDHR